MRTLEYIALGLSIALLIIAVHQTIIYGFLASYWIFMLSLLMLLLKRLIARKERDNQFKAIEKKLKKRKKR